MKFLVTLLIALLTFATADAAKVDIYRDAIKNKTFTLKYKIYPFPYHTTNRETKIFINQYGGAEKITDEDPVQMKSELKSTGIVVFDKDRSYIESVYYGLPDGDSVYTKDEGYSALIKNDEIFEFLIQFSKGKKRYWGITSWGFKTSKVKAEPIQKFEERKKQIFDRTDPYTRLLLDYRIDYDNYNLEDALKPLFPPENVVVTPDNPICEFFAEGTLESGLTFEDFYGEKNNTFKKVIRYYFDGDKMVKIAVFHFSNNERGILRYKKYIVDIEEFSTTPDEKYFKMPEGITDATKRDKDGGKK